MRTSWLGHPQASYGVTGFDTGRAQTLTVRDLMDDGRPVTIQTQPGAIVLTYKPTGLTALDGSLIVR